MSEDLKLIKDYYLVKKYQMGDESIEIEDVNDILLSNEYHNKYGEYGSDNFLRFYKNKIIELINQVKEPEVKTTKMKKGV